MKSFVPEQQRSLILGLVTGRMTKAEFTKVFSGDPSETAVQWLNNSVAQRDPLAVELSLHLGHRFGFPDASVPALITLATADWHQRHEDVVHAISLLRPPESVDALFALATTYFPYRDYDRAQSLPVKCVRALRQLDTIGAVIRLAELSRLDDAIVSQAAHEMLRRLAEESSSDQVRDAAAKVLS